MSCIGSALTTATWRSGYATVCKTVYPGSIPGVASNKIKNLYNPHILPSHCVSEPSAKSIPQFEQGSHRRRRHHVGVGNTAELWTNSDSATVTCKYSKYFCH